MICSGVLKSRLEKAPVWVLSVYAALCSFGVYCCMYAFRKPFTAAGFEGVTYWHTGYKVWLVTAQVIGYMLSKFYGIRFISAMRAEKRANTIVWLITVAWASLLLFALVPAPYNILFLFLNGFPLGMVWGLVFAYLEGRKTTELMGAVLCVNFILSSGIVKSVGKFLLVTEHVSEWWMPFYAGGLFFIPMLVFTWLLNHMPPPSEEDRRLRSPRVPMTAEERRAFTRRFLPGLIMIVITYVLLTALRDFRDNFANELWTELGFGGQAAIFTASEVPVSVIVLVSLSLMILIKDNFRAFMVNHYIITGGFLLALMATVLFSTHWISPTMWMILVGTGLYLSYIPFNCLYFERMIASYRITGNAGFLIYIADSFGYLGSVTVLFIREFAGIQLSWTGFFSTAVIVICVLGMTGTFLSFVYFRKKYLSVAFKTQTSYA